MPAKLPAEFACEISPIPQSADGMDEKALRRAQAATELAIQEAERAHARLREAIDILPQGIAFPDPEGRYILWSQKYAEIYKRSADQFTPGAPPRDPLPLAVARGDCAES